MRARIMRVSAQLLVELCKPGIHCAEVVGNALPADARVLGTYGVQTSPEYPGLFVLVIESESFDDVPSMNRLPEHPDVTFTKRRLVQIKEGDFDCPPESWHLWREEDRS